MTVRVRFAPSPTGRMHVGNARVALLNWLFAKSAPAGAMILRMDDTDTARSKPEYVEGIKADLAWLGLTWDRLEHQSARLEAYRAAETKLRAAGRLYPCYETPEELEFKRRLQRSRGEPPVYDRAALSLTDAERAALEAEGRKPHFRFRLDPGDSEWNDLARGACHYAGAHLSDPILIREDRTYLYMLPSVVDDIAFDVTHVIRGEDHVTNTAVQIQLFRALGGTPPVFAHLPLLVDADGGPLSKRTGSLALRDLRDRGLEAMALNSLLARLGTPDPATPETDLSALVDGFDIGRFGRAAPRFSDEELWSLNRRLIAGLDHAAVAPRLAALGIEADAAFWEAIRANIDRLEDAALWWSVCAERINPVIEESAYLESAAERLPEEPFDGDTWQAWTADLKTFTGRKGKALFLPLRLALTGQPHGPELDRLLPLIGRETALRRLRGEVA